MPATPPLCGPRPRQLPVGAGHARDIYGWSTRIEHEAPSRSLPPRHIPEIVPDDLRDERPLSGRGLRLKRSIGGSCKDIARYAAQRHSGTAAQRHSGTAAQRHSNSSSASGRRLSR